MAGISFFPNGNDGNASSGTGTVYLYGDERTDGSWRFQFNATKEMEVQFRQSGKWVAKGKVTSTASLVAGAFLKAGDDVTPYVKTMTSAAAGLVPAPATPTGRYLRDDGTWQDVEADGVPGPAGPQGERGIKGDPGDTGPQGPQGEPGPQGGRGETGPQGEQGLEGAVGPQGVQGEKGPQGTKGDTGPAGPAGATGAAGAKGDKGDKGDVGPVGPQGIQGAQGAQGVVGPQGPKGDTGATGPAGAQGVAGAQGPAGTSYTPQPPVARTGITVATAYQHADVTKPYNVTVNARAVQSITLAGTVGDKVELRIGPTAASVLTNGVGGLSVGVWESSITGVALMVGAAIAQGGQMMADVPAGWYFAINRISGTNTAIVSCFTQSLTP